MSDYGLPDGFLFGTATSSYQIEGAWNEDGKGESIWDRFAHTPGCIENGDTGDTACDHYHRWQEDIGLMSDLGLDAYRLSVSWPRILPNGTGRVNQAGLDFYDRLVDRLLQAGIQPFITLYHWDLPQALQERGGWASRDVVGAFVDYSRVVVNRLGDRVKTWITLNEPLVSSFVGHIEGRHAPGHKDVAEALAVVHHLLLAHGRCIHVLRDAVPNAHLGITNIHHPVHAASSSEHDALAAEQYDGFANRTFLDPLVGRGYPEVVPYDRSILEAAVRPGDMEQIAAPIDFLGVNYYTRAIVRSDAVNETDNAPRSVHPADEATEMGWEVYPQGLYEILSRIHNDYAFPSYYITENGAAFTDVLDVDGEVRDVDRISYLRRHLIQVSRAISAGIPLRGYFVWSLLDNLEWAHGFSKRFGLVHVDHATQVRTPKSSYYWYAKTIAERVVE